MHFEYKGHFVAIIDEGNGTSRIRIDDGCTLDKRHDHVCGNPVAYAQLWINQFCRPTITRADTVSGKN